MEYIRKENDKIVKYNVNYDKKLLEEIRFEIIENCGVRTHVSEDTDYPGYCLDERLVRNYTASETGEEIEYDVETRDVYHVEYDLITEPKLAYLIGSFLDSKDTTLLKYVTDSEEFVDTNTDSTLEYKYALRVETIKNIIKLLNTNKYQGKTEIKKIKILLDGLEHLENDIALNEKLNLKDQVEYLDIIKEAITLTKVDEIDSDTYEKVMKFKKNSRG